MKIKTLLVKFVITATLIAMVSVVVGCGGSSSSNKEQKGATGQTGNKGVATDALAPKDALVYGAVSTSEQGQALSAAVSKLMGTNYDLGNKLIASINKELKDGENKALKEMTYEADIKPWAGTNYAFFVQKKSADTPKELPVDFAIIAEVKDKTKAQQTVDKLLAADKDKESNKQATYKDVKYTLSKDGGAVGFVDNYLVLASESALKATVDTKASAALSIKENADYKDSIGRLPSDSLGFVYMGKGAIPALYSELGKSSAYKKQHFDLGKFGKAYSSVTSAAAFSVKDDSFIMKTTQSSSTSGKGSFDLATLIPEEGMKDLPSDSWYAFSFGNTGAFTDWLLDIYANSGVLDVSSTESEFKAATGLDLHKDLLSWLGDSTFFMKGTDVQSLGVGLGVKVKDQAAAGKVVDKLGAAIKKKGQIPLTATTISGAKGFQINAAGISVDVALKDDKFVVGYGRDAASSLLEPAQGQTLGDSEDFKDVVNYAGDQVPIFYVKFSPILKLLSSLPNADDAQLAKAKPYLERMNYVVATFGKSDNHIDGTLIFKLN